MFKDDKSFSKKHTAILSDLNEEVTYEELWSNSEKFEKEVGSRNLFFILCNYSIDTVAFYYTIMASKNVPLLLSDTIEAEFLNDLIRTYKPSYIWMKKDYLSKLQLDQKSILGEKNQFYLISTGYETYPLDAELALLLTTSGSTGNSKLVRLSYTNLDYNAVTFINTVNLRQDDKVITTLPMNYTYGLSLLHAHWKLGAQILITQKGILEEAFWRFLEQSKATNFAGTPLQYEIMNKIEVWKQPLSTLRFITQGGGKLSLELQKHFGNETMERGIEFYIFYGQTEGTTYLTALAPEKVLDKLGSIGIPLSGMKARLKKGNELIFEGKSVCMGYAERIEDLKAGDFNHGILHTGDIATMDNEGYIYLQGRSKRFIKIFGVRINLDDIERLAAIYVKNGTVACLGEDDNLRFFYDGEKIDELELKKYLSNQIHINKKTITITHKIQIPRTSAGKVAYMNL